MFPQRYFGGRFFAARYFPKAGAPPSPFNPQWAVGSTTYVGGVYPDTVPR